MALPPTSSPGSLADVYEPLPSPAPTPAREPVTMGEVFDASRVYSRVDRGDAESLRLTRGFEPILDAVNSGLPDDQQFVDPGAWLKEGGNLDSVAATLLRRPSRRESLNPLSWFRDRVTVRKQMENIFAEVRRRRQNDPAFLPGVPDTWQEYYAGLIARDKKERGAAADTLSRASGISDTLAQFAGGARELQADPVNIASLPLGGGIGAGKGLVITAAREGLINGIIEAAQQPQVASNRRQLGEDLSLGDAAINVGTAATFGAAFPIALHGAGKAAGKAYDASVSTVFKALPEAAQQRWASKMKVGDQPIGEFYAGLSNTEAAQFARDAIGAEALTPDERAAAAVLEREQQVGEASPYVGGPAGDATHGGQLATAIKDLLDNRVPREGEPSAPTRGAEAGAPGGAPERPPAGEPVARPRSAAAAFVGDAIGRFKSLVRRKESGGNDAAANPRSSAQGRYQFTDGTFVDYYQRRYGKGLSRAEILARKKDPAIQEALMDDLTRDNGALLERGGEAVTPGNLYLVHFLGPQALKVLKAAPETPIERLVSAEAVRANPEVLGGGKSASQVVAWAQRTMGGHAAEVPVREGFALGGGVTEDPAIAQLKEEALRLSDQAIGEERLAGGGSVPPMGTGRFRPSELAVDAERFQFKSGGDAQGVTERLRGTSEWNPIYAGRVVVWEDLEGKLFIADGHQRRALAERIEADTGQPLHLDGTVLRAADGVTAEDARTWAALKNIAEGTGSAVDAAKIVRQVGADALKDLPPKSALVRDGAALARLSDEAFGAVYNGVIAPDIAAVVGHLAPDKPEAHAGLVKLLVELDPANRGQAESLVRQAIAAGFTKETQDELFGARELVSSLFMERAKVLERGLSELRKLKGVFGVASRNADTLENAGSKIARSKAEQEAARNGQALEIVSRLAFSKGAVADALNHAAEQLARGAKLGDVVGEFVRSVRELDLGQLGREATDDSGRLAPDGAGRGGDAGSQDALFPAQSAGEGQPRLVELEAATQRFSDPDGKPAAEQADSLFHDLKSDLERASAGQTRREQIKAATAELADVEAGGFKAVRPFPQSEPDYYRFRHVTADGQEVTGTYTFDPESGVIDNFAINSKEGANSSGPAAVRQLGRQLQEAHPQATVLRAYRTTGARAGEEFVDIPLRRQGKPDLSMGESAQLTPVDPNIVDRQRQEAQLKAASPLQAGADQESTIGSPLFDAVDQGKLNLGEMTFRLSDEGPEISGADLLAELEADDAAIAALKGCL